MSAPHSTPTNQSETSGPHGAVGSGVSPVGRVVAERYRVEKVLGEGAMGAVYLAEHIHMRKRYAMKILHPEIASPEIIARFEREAVAAANITHPNIACATDFGRLEDGSFFLVLEYVAGKDLRTAISPGGMHPRRALGIVRQILAAMSAAHGLGVIHRDLKPENVMLVEREDGDDQVKVLDFGIAKLDESGLSDNNNSPLTRMGAVYGTPSYMSPEQGMGKPVDARADLYAVGVILYELIAGHPPFEGDGIMVIAKHVNDPIPPLECPVAPEALTSKLRALVEQLLAKERDDRPADAQETLALLEEAELSLPLETSRAATAYGETPSPATHTPRSPNARSLHPTIRRLADKIGVSERILVGFSIAGAATFLLLVILLVARSGKTEEDDEHRRPRKRSQVTATEPTTSASTSAAPSSEPTMGALPPTTSEPSTAPSGSATPPATGGKKKGGGGGLGSKIKSIFH
jgi:serine/threonine protein kinase